MTSRMDRRGFLTTGARAGLTLCGACLCARLPAFAEGDEEPIDPKKLEYCGYRCPDDCKFRTATLNDNEELKREAFEAWKIKERFGIDFDPEQAVCYGCKAEGKPEGIVVRRCDVRTCVKEKRLDCCIECDELTACEKDLWKRFPKFKEKVVEMQQRYRAQTAG